MSQITTHILDTTLGKPAVGVKIELEQKTSNSWKKLANGFTNTDGRISDLLPSDFMLELGVYRMTFDTASYFLAQKTTSFYPSICIEFQIFDNKHYHIPLLLNPFGYSTYRGS